MKKYIICFSLVVSFIGGFSQVNDNCINAIPLCSTPSFTFYTNSGPGSIIDFSIGSTISNPTNNPFPPDAGCLNSGELNPQWLILTIGNAGLLEFVFGAGNSPNPQAGCYDWAMWPYSPTACNDILNNTLPPIRCNWNGTCNGGTGIASASNMATFGGNPADFGEPLPVNACQQFVICISNYTGVNTLVSFQSMGTASLSCSPNCSPNYSICYGSNATITPVNYAALANPVFSLQPGNLSNTTGSFVVSPTVTTTYTTYITGTNLSNSNETIIGSSTVTVFAQPNAVPTVTNATCASTLNAVNLNLVFNPNGITPPSYTVNWSPIPNGISTTSQTTFTGGIGAGLYNATITTADGCTTTANFSVNPLPTPVTPAVIPLGTTHSITCISDVTLTATNPAYNYTWSSNVAVFTTSTVVFTSTLAGTWTLTTMDPVSLCSVTQTYAIVQNTITPVASITPSLQNITCNLTSITTVTAVANPSINVTNIIMSPQGGTFSAQSYTTIYVPGGVGIFTHCAVNDANGCKSCNTFTVTSNQGFPTYSVISADNFTLGCGSKSIANISIVNANSNPVGGPVSYTLIGPPTSTATPSGALSGTAVYTVNVPGTWTVITKDNTSFCETRTPISILSNTFTPDISAIVPRLVLDCYVPKVTLKGQSITNNISYLWSFPGNPGTLQGDTITVFSIPTAPTTSVIANYTLTITDNSSTCKSFTTVPMRQNLYLPTAAISGGTSSLSCKTATIVLTNQSSTGIPPATGFPYQQPVIGYLWDGPSPQEQGQLQTTYIAATTGVYTLTARDLNNGCMSTATTVISDNRVYPDINKPIAPPPATLDCGSNTAKISSIVNGSSTGFTYSWTSVPGSSVSGQTTATLTTNKIGNYRVLITNTLNGCSTLGEAQVVNGALDAEFEVEPAQGVAPLTVTFYNNSASSLGAGNITSYWNFSNGTSSVTTAFNLSPTTTYSLPGTYKVMMYANKGTCLDTAFQYIEVEISSSLEIPNVFTPNGDNVNDLFFLKTTNLGEISVLIYDRWGHKVYELTSTTGNIAWDGKTQMGKEAAEGTYFYIIKATGKDAQAFEKKGTVSLYR